MKSLVISDGGHRYLLQIREDSELPSLPKQEVPVHMQFLDWWRTQCSKMAIPYTYRIAEPMGIRIIQSLLKKNSLDDLKELGLHFFLDHGQKLREDPRHFAIFASMVDTMKKELSRES